MRLCKSERERDFMKRGTLYYKLDCLDVLETIKDGMFSLIYLDMPSSIVERSKRIVYEKGSTSLKKFCEDKGCEVGELNREEIGVFLKKSRAYERKAKEEYLYKVIHNCYRVLDEKGIIVYRVPADECDTDSVGMILNFLFRKIGTKVLDRHGRGLCAEQNDFDLVYFYSKDRGASLPPIYELRAEERFPYEDEKGKYRFESLLWRSGHKRNTFEWKGFLPRGETEWRYSEQKLNELYEKGDIVINRDYPKLKCYREEHPVPVSSIWNMENFWERVFTSFTNEEDRVLGIYENFGFAHQATKRKLIWNSIIPKTSNDSFFMGQKQIEGQYFLVDKLIQKVASEYEIMMSMPVNRLDENLDIISKVSREYVLSKEENRSVGITTDEILVFYIDAYLYRVDISESKFCSSTDVSRQTIQKMRNEIAKLKTMSEEEKKIKAKKRERDTIIRIAVYTGMPLADTLQALKSSGHTFDDSVLDRSILEWMFEESCNIKELNKIIERNCGISGIDDYENMLFTEPYTAKKIVSR